MQMKNAVWDHAHVGELKRYDFSVWHFLFSFGSVTFCRVCSDNNPFYEALGELCRGGSLATIVMRQNSDSHFPPHRNLLYFLMYLKHLQQCLEHRKCSINICWVGDPGMETNRGIPPVLEVGTATVEVVGSFPASWRLRKGVREDQTWREIWRVRIGPAPTDSLLPALRPFLGQVANHCLWINPFVCA